MTPELHYLVWAVALLLVHVVIQAVMSVLGLGIGYALGPQDEGRAPKSLIAQRLERALMNFIETFPAFAALAIVIAVAGKSTEMTVLGASLYFWARVVYVPLYALGIPVARTLAWLVSFVGIVLMLWPLLAS